MHTLISDLGIRKIIDRLTAAGDDWQQEATRIPLIMETIPGTTSTRDHAELARGWAMPVNNGHCLVECPPVIYRDEHGQWHPMGWSSASQGQLYRPAGVTYDADAGVYVSSIDEEVSE